MKKKLKLKNLSQEQKYNLATGGLAALLVGGTATLVQLLGTKPASYSQVDETETGDMIDNDMPMIEGTAEVDILADSPVEDIESPFVEDVVEVETELEITEYDSPSFAEAFSAARAANGPGHIFEWSGSNYTTYYAEEIEELSPDADDAFVQVIAESTESGAVYGVDLDTEGSTDAIEDGTVPELQDTIAVEQDDVDHISDETPSETLDNADFSEPDDVDLAIEDEDVMDVDDEDMGEVSEVDQSDVDTSDFFDDAFGDASEQIVSSSDGDYTGDIVSVDLGEVGVGDIDDNTLYADASDTVSADGTEAFVIVDDADFEDPTFGDATSLAESSNTDGDGGTSYVDATDFNDAAFGDDTSEALANNSTEEDYAIDDLQSTDSEVDVIVDDIDNTIEDVFEDDAFDTGL